MPWSSVIPALLGTREGEYLWSAAIKLKHWGIQDVKTQDTGPGTWNAYERNDFSEPRLLHLPIHRNAPSSLTWDILFTVVSDYEQASRLVIVWPAHQASLSFTISHSLLNLMSIESVMPSDHLVLCCSLIFNSQKYSWCSDCLPFAANFYITWFLPTPCPAFSEQFSQGYLRCCLPSLKCPKFPSNKT